MNIKKMGLIGSTVLVMASLGMAFSNTPQGANAAPSASHAQVPSLTATANAAETTFAVVPPAPVALPVSAGPAAVNDAKLGLVAPPAVLPKAGKKLAVSAVAGASSAQASVKTGAKKTSKAQVAQAGVKKPKNLFSYIRTLSYSPHPQEEEFLRDQPLTLNGSQYHISVAYREKWNVVDDEEGYIKGLGFDINVFQDGKKVRTLKVPDVALKNGKLQKGQVVGLAEVAPYKFKIAIHDFTTSDGGYSDVTFKFDMTS